MSINSCHLDAQAGPSLSPGERSMVPGCTSDIEIRIPATTEGPKRVLSGKGRIWVTDQRVLWSANLPNAPLESFELPYSVLLSTKFNLPLFSPNHISLAFLPDPNNPQPNLPNPGRGSELEAKLVVGEGQAHAVWKIIEGQRAYSEERRRRGEEENLPMYEP